MNNSTLEDSRVSSQEELPTKEEHNTPLIMGDVAQNVKLAVIDDREVYLHEFKKIYIEVLKNK